MLLTDTIFGWIFISILAITAVLLIGDSSPAWHRVVAWGALGTIVSALLMVIVVKSTEDPIVGFAAFLLSGAAMIVYACLPAAM